MDALELPKDKVMEQWKTWHQVWKAECQLPVRQVLGNHDIFGWARPNPSPEGKRWALDELGLKRSYYSFDQAGWHFIVLDSMRSLPNFYEARLDEEQYDWLCQDLAAHSQPTCIISHIPLICFCAFFDGPNESSGHWRVPGAWMHLDARRIKDLLRRHAQVKLCLSGHIHLQDHVRYLGIDYYCNGAVCGNYWRGAYQDFEPAYFIVDLFADGSHLCQRVDDFGAKT
jgi:3',5'-cyclic AMP phosphodiesterase CpdA